MTIFSRAKPVSSLALAMALAIGATATTFVTVADPAYAQRNRDRDNQEQSQTVSSEYAALYGPIDQAAKSNPPDWAQVAARLPELLAISNSADERLFTGDLMRIAGAQTGNDDLQLQGLQLMLQSGKTPQANLGIFNYIVYQLLSGRGQHVESRPYLQNAIDQNFTFEGFTTITLQSNMFNTFAQAGDYAGGVNYLVSEFDRIKAETGQPAEETLYAMAVQTSFDNALVPQAYNVSQEWVTAYPKLPNWRNAINVVRALGNYDINDELLDLLRLSRVVGTLDNNQDYLTYVDSARANQTQVPIDVVSVLQEGLAAGAIDSDDTFVSELIDTLSNRVAEDRAEIPTLVSSAQEPGAPLRRVTGNAHVLLAFGEFEAAETLYTQALNMAGADRNEVLTRLGIAQVSQGKFDAARASFGQITGSRQPIAQLWTAYTDVEAAKQVMPAAAPAPEEQASVEG